MYMLDTWCASSHIHVIDIDNQHTMCWDWICIYTLPISPSLLSLVKKSFSVLLPWWPSSSSLFEILLLVRSNPSWIVYRYLLMYELWYQVWSRWDLKQHLEEGEGRKQKRRGKAWQITQGWTHETTKCKRKQKKRSINGHTTSNIRRTYLHQIQLVS